MPDPFANDPSTYGMRPFREEVNFALEMFDAGLLRPGESKVPLSMTNSVYIGSMMGGAVQQGTTHSTQNVSMNIDLGAARTAIDQLEVAMAKLSDDVVSQIRPDIDTIKAQLAKGSPSQFILHEAGQGLKSIACGVVAGLLTPQFDEALASLLRALGLA